MAAELGLKNVANADRSLPMTNPTEEERLYLAQFLARKIFEAPAGANPNDVQRIAYRGCVVGSHGAERDYGGSNEDSLAKILFDALEGFANHEHVYEDDIVYGPDVIGRACSICGIVMEYDTDE